LLKPPVARGRTESPEGVKEGWWTVFAVLEVGMRWVEGRSMDWEGRAVGAGSSVAPSKGEGPRVGEDGARLGLISRC